jgi:oligopeptide transport system permease protein
MIITAHHIRTVRALGLSDFSVVVKHAMRGAMLPIALRRPRRRIIANGPVIAETIFPYRALAVTLSSSLEPRLHPVMGTVVLIAIFTVLFNLIVDIVYALLIRGCAMTDVRIEADVHGR